MNGRVVREIRKAIYGDMSIRNTKYKRAGVRIEADSIRQAYQRAKQNYKEG